MNTRIEDYAQWIPTLADNTQLYHDQLLDRWVISSLNQVVFLNQFTYEVLKRCDGKNNLRMICQQLICQQCMDDNVIYKNTGKDNGVDKHKIKENVVNILLDFDANGFIFNEGNNPLKH